MASTSWSNSRGPSTGNEPVERLEPYSDPEVVEANSRIFEELKADPKFSEFFSFTFPDMKVGRVIAKGGHDANARIFEGEFSLMQRKFPCALKILKRGLKFNLSKQFPDGMLTGGSAVFPGFSSGASLVLGGLILEDGIYAGSFAFVLRRVWGSLRALTELRMSKLKSLKRSPFGDMCGKKMMLEIAIAMQQLHGHGILHRFLIPDNIMVCTSTPPSLLPNDIEDAAFHVNVFNFESTVGLLNGYTSRPPEIHRQKEELDMQNRSYDAITYTNKSDVYSFALTCSEILTGDEPFGHISLRDMDLVVNGSLRPRLPKRMDKWLRDLITKCWDSNPSQRPEFEEIVQIFKSMLPDTTSQTVEQEVETSKSHWSEICNFHNQDNLQAETNRQIFENLKQHPEFSNFFSYTFRDLKRGRKIAEGGRAKIFEAEFEKENGAKVPCVVKLFKHMSLRDMVQQWPPGMLRSGDSPGHLRFGFVGLLRGATRTCEVLGAMVDENDDFAFIFNREGGDLRRLIELRMRQPKSTHNRPFKPESAKRILYEIALGMQHLHDRGIFHRDLKAANVLVTNLFGEFPSDGNDELIDVKVADFECSMLVEGTRFWRAPEILQQIKSRTVRTYTRESDVYSFGMTCYEVLTGGIPLEHLENYDYAAICERGERPELPDGIDGWLKRLVERCWHSEPSERSEFKEIVEEFEKHCPMFKSLEHHE